MCKLITEIISKIFGGLNIKTTNRSSHNSIKGDANNSSQAGRDLINLSNNAFFFSFAYSGAMSASNSSLKKVK